MTYNNDFVITPLTKEKRQVEFKATDRRRNFKTDCIGLMARDYPPRHILPPTNCSLIANLFYTVRCDPDD